MNEYPIEKAYEHDTILFKKIGFLKIRVTIYAPANVYFVERKDGNTFNFYAKIDQNETDTSIIAHREPEKEISWDNNAANITTKVFDPDSSEKSSNAIHTDNATPY